jgi:glycosyltransferase involved in cell wall biosynthesis
VLRATHERLTRVLRGVNALDYELIFVNDGSRDRTQEILTELQLFDPRSRVLLLSRNFGHQIAVTAGLTEAAGDAVVIIDADLQDPPELIPQMVQLWRDGNEVVYGIRIERDGESRFKLWTAKVFYRLINRLSETKMPLDAGDFRLLDRKVVEVLKAMPERARFLRGMVSWAGGRPVRSCRASRRQEQVSAHEDDSLRHGRHHLVFTRAAETRNLDRVSRNLDRSCRNHRRNRGSSARQESRARLGFAVCGSAFYGRCATRVTRNPGRISRPNLHGSKAAPALRGPGTTGLSRRRREGDRPRLRGKREVDA